MLFVLTHRNLEICIRICSMHQQIQILENKSLRKQYTFSNATCTCQPHTSQWYRHTPEERRLHDTSLHGPMLERLQAHGAKILKTDRTKAEISTAKLCILGQHRATGCRKLWHTFLALVLAILSNFLMTIRVSVFVYRICGISTCKK